MNFYKRWWGIIALCVVGLISISCERDSYYEGNDITLKFSSDTLRFDTVFTSVGSATRWIKVFNPISAPVLADFKLVNNSGYFRMNVDGIQGDYARQVEIGAKDSIYIFVEVTINPDLPVSISPFIVEDRIEVVINGKEQIIYLEAFGQNANYLPRPNSKGSVSLLSCNLGEFRFDDPKPYVIYGILYVDSCNVVIPAGTRIYVHGGVIRRDSLVYEEGMIIFLKNGKLVSEGTVDKPVVFQGDRLESAFQNLSGQWVGIVFIQGSVGHRLQYTTIKNSIIGVQVDSASTALLEGCRIFNTSASGIIGRHSEIYAENCLFYNNGANGIRLIYGGNYEFNYCTVASYSGRQEALIATDFFCRDILCTDGIRFNRFNGVFRNCIFAGNDKDEITLLRRSPDSQNMVLDFSHCLVKVADLLKPDAFPRFLEECPNCINLRGNERLFADRNKDIYSLDSLSVAINRALPLSGITSDIEGKLRKANTPDAGCFEL